MSRKLVALVSSRSVRLLSVTVNNNSPIQDYVNPDDQTLPTFEKFSISQKQLLNELVEWTSSAILSFFKKNR